ncbi:MAG: hypothetical protein MI785_02030 [Kiloniellales bacterium]|nr:hypothetical protein [Kiloniellales bacterium]
MNVSPKDTNLTIQDALLLSAAVHILKSIDVGDRDTAQELSGLADRLNAVVEDAAAPAGGKKFQLVT